MRHYRECHELTFALTKSGILLLERSHLAARHFQRCIDTDHSSALTRVLRMNLFALDSPINNYEDNNERGKRDGQDAGKNSG
jgi:hypothetical protein